MAMSSAPSRRSLRCAKTARWTRTRRSSATLVHPSIGSLPMRRIIAARATPPTAGGGFVAMSHPE